MTDTKLIPCLTICACLPLLCAPMAQAAAGPELALSYAWFGDADLDGGGELGFEQATLRAGFENAYGRGQSWGLSAEVSYHNYDFSGALPQGGVSKWDKVMDYGLSASWRKPSGQRGMWFIAPSITAARGEGADLGESLQFGGIVSYGYRYSDRLTIGFGAGVFHGLEETEAFPVLLVSWQINDNWRVGNPFRPGPAGPAGIELVYSTGGAWEIGLGAGWRSHRFRLDEQGVNPDGIGEVEGFPAFARLTWKASEAVTIDLSGGLLLAGEITEEDASGHTLHRDDLDSAPIVALSIQAAF